MADIFIISGSGSPSAGGASTTVVQPTASNLNAQVQGPAAADAAASGNPVLIGGVDNAGNVQELPVADSGTTAPSQVLLVGGTLNNGNISAINTQSLSNLLVTQVLQGDGNSNANVYEVGNNGSPFGGLVEYPHLFNGTTWDRQRSGGATGMAGVAGAAATGVAVAGNPVYVAGKDGSGNAQPLGVTVISATTAPTTAEAILSVNNTTPPSLTTGQSVALQSDYEGSVFVKPYRRGQTAAKATQIANSSSATTVVTAQAAGIFADLTDLIITVLPLAAAAAPINFTATLSDGTNSFIYNMQTVAVGTGVLAVDPNPGLNFHFSVPIPATTAATAWTITLSVNTVTVNITTVAVLQKAS